MQFEIKIKPWYEIVKSKNQEESDLSDIEDLSQHSQDYLQKSI